MPPQNPRQSSDPEIDRILSGYVKDKVNEEADRQRVPRDYVQRIAQTESAYKPDVIKGQRRSSAGAIGPMQVMPGTAKDLKIDPYNVNQNIEGGVRYAGEQLRAFGNDQRKASAAYNWGPGNVRKYGVERAPAETQNYMRKVAGQAQQADPEIENLLKQYQQEKGAQQQPAQTRTYPKQYIGSETDPAKQKADKANWQRPFSTNFDINEVGPGSTTDNPPKIVPVPRAPQQPSTTTPNVFNKTLAQDQRAATQQAKTALNFRPAGGNVARLEEDANRITRQIAPEVRQQVNARDARLQAQRQQSAQRGVIGQRARDVYQGVANLGQQAQRGFENLLTFTGARDVAEMSPEIKAQMQQGKLAQEATNQRMAEEQQANDSMASQLTRGTAQAVGGTAMLAPVAMTAGIPGLMAATGLQQDWEKDPKGALLNTATAGLPVVAGKAISPVAGRIAGAVRPALQRPVQLGIEAAAGGAANVGQYAGTQAALGREINPEEALVQGITGAGLSGVMAPNLRQVQARNQARQALRDIPREPQAPMNLTPTAVGPTERVKVTPGDFQRANLETQKGFTEPLTEPLPATPQAAPAAPVAADAAPAAAGLPNRADFEPGFVGDVEYQAALADAQRAPKAAKPAKPAYDPAAFRGAVDDAKIQAGEAEAAGNWEAARDQYRSAMDTITEMQKEARRNKDATALTELAREKSATNTNWQMAKRNAERAAKQGAPSGDRPAVKPRQVIENKAPVVGDQAVSETAPTRDLSSPLPASVDIVPRTTAEIPRTQRSVQPEPTQVENKPILPPVQTRESVLTPPTNRITEGAGDELPRRVSRPLAGQPAEVPTKYTEYEGGEMQRYSKPLEGQPVEVPEKAKPAPQYSPAEAALREREALPPIERRRALRDATYKGQFGKLSETARKRGDRETSLAENPQLRRLLDLPEMPPYRLPDAPINPKTGEPYTNPAWTEAAQDTLNALAAVAGKERSSQINFEMGERTGVSPEMMRRFAGTDWKTGLTQNAVPPLKASRVAPMKPGQPTRGEAGDLFLAVQELARKRGEQIDPSLRAAFKGTVEGARTAKAGYEAFVVDERLADIENSLREIYRNGKLSSQDNTAHRDAFREIAAEYGVSTARADANFAGIKAQAASRAQRAGEAQPAPANQGESESRSRSVVGAVEQRATGTDGRSAEGGGRAAVQEAKPVKPSANPIVRPAVEGAEVARIAINEQESKGSGQYNGLDYRVANDGTVSVAHSVTGRGIGTINLNTGEVIPANTKYAERLNAVHNHLKQKAADALREEEIGRLKNYPARNAAEIKRLEDERTATAGEAKPAEKPARPVTPAASQAEGAAANLSRQEWGQVKHDPNTGLYWVTTFDDVGATREGYSLGRSQGRGKQKRTVAKTFESKQAAETYLDKLYARELKAGRIPAAPEKINVPSWVDREGNVRPALGEVEILPQTAQDKEDGFRRFRPVGEDKQFPRGGTIEEAWYQSAKQSTGATPAPTFDTLAQKMAEVSPNAADGAPSREFKASEKFMSKPSRFSFGPLENEPSGPVATMFGGQAVLDALKKAKDATSFGELPKTRADVENSPRFKKWFGDSKVVDGKGRPLVVYHGTPRGGFDVFDSQKSGTRDDGWYGKGFYFSASSLGATGYMSDASGRLGDNSALYPVYLKIERPLIVKSLNDLANKLQAQGANPNASGAALTREIQRLGYDGVMADSGGEIVVFKPTQIKSAIGNSGAFNPESGSILSGGIPGQKILDNLRAGRRQVAPKTIPADFNAQGWIRKAAENLAAQTLSDADKAKVADPKTTTAEKAKIYAAAKIDPAQQNAFQAAMGEAFTALSANDYNGFQDAANRLKAISDAPATNWEKASAIRKAAMLSRPVSHLRNLIGNTAFQNLEEVARIPGSIGDAMLSGITGRRTLQGASVEDSARAIYEAATGGITAAKDAMAGRSNEEIAKALQTREVNFNNKVVDKAVKFVFRSLGAEDQIFYTGAYDRAIRESAKLTARNEARQGIINRADVKARQNALLAAPTPQMEIDAALAAETAVFRNDNKLSSGIAGFRDKIGDKGNFALDLVLPFDRTPTNVVLRALEYSPLGVARGAVKGVAGSARTIAARRAAKKAGTPSKADVQAAIDKAFTPTQHRCAAQLLGRGAVGSGLLALGYALASKGLMTGFYDDEDYKGEAMKRATGAQPLAIQIGGRWYGLNGVGPIGMALGMGATIQQEANKKGGDMFGASAKAAKEQVMEAPLLSSLKDLSKDVERVSRDRANAGKLVGNLASSFVPGVLNDLGQSILYVRDPFEREVKDDPKKVKGLRRALREGAGQVGAKIPGVRRMLPMKKDITGKPIPSRPLAPIDPFSSRPATGPLPRKR